MSAHSLLPPSSMALVIKCPATLAIPKPPQKTTIFTERGTRYHEIMEKWLRDGEELPDDYAVQIASKYPAMLASNPDITLECEKRVFFGDLIGVDDDIAFGTSDIVGYNHSTDTLFVIDYKFGKHKVECEENIQLALYAWGAYRQAPRARTVQMAIIQPENGKDRYLSTWLITVEYLKNFLDEKLKDCREDIRNYLVLGCSSCLKKCVGEHCHKYFCHNKANCKEYVQYVWNAV